MFGDFTSQERTNVHWTTFFLHTPDSPLSKVTALKVVWEMKALLGAAKSLEVTFFRVSRRGRHFANVGDFIIYPDLVWPGLMTLTVLLHGKGQNMGKAMAHPIMFILSIFIMFD